MLRQCIKLNQKDWVTKLPGIEFAINLARSESTGYAPFFLNHGCMPRPMVWDASLEYPGIRGFAQKMKEAIISVHNTIIEAHMKQIQQNRKKKYQNIP
ncbi:hypothetical protein K439DRAFT_1343143 [Ramaria rubella]|nr:hypothetical protein K439DRAFT_1343143 [Ramaria rubella]